MKKSAYSEQREMIVAEAINPIATELRFQNPSENPDENTEFLRKSLTAARFAPTRQGEAA